MPFIAAAAAVGAFLGGIGVITVTIAGSSILAGALIYGGIALAAKLLSPKTPDLGTARPDTRQLITASVQPARWVLGTARVGGMLTYYYEPDKGDPYDDNCVYVILTLCEGPIEGIQKIWVDGEEISWRAVKSAQWGQQVNTGEFAASHSEGGAPGPVIPHGAFVNPVGTKYEIDARRTWGDRPGGMLIIPFNNGLTGPEGVFHLLAEPKFSKSAWAHSMFLANKACVWIRMVQPDYGSDIEKRIFYRFPNFEFLVKGSKITWPGQEEPAWTDNAASIYYWWLTQRRQVPPEAIDIYDFNVAYDICEKEIDNTLPQSYQDQGYPSKSKRYSINGVVRSDDDHESIETEFDFSWAGYALEANGIYRFRPGIDRAPIATIGEADIIRRGRIAPAPSLSDRVNAGHMRLAQSASHDWTAAAIPELRDDAAILRDGRALPRDFNTRAFVCCPVAGGRLLATMLRRARANKIYQYRITPGDRFERLGLIPTDRITLHDPDIGVENMPAVILSRQVNGDLSIDLSLEFAPDGIYSDEIILPPDLIGAQEFPDILRGPAGPTGVMIWATAELTEDYTVRSTIHASWNPVPHRTRMVVERADPSMLNPFKSENVVDGDSNSVGVPFAGIYKVTLWHVDHLNILSRPYAKTVNVDWSALGIEPIHDRVNRIIQENPAFQLTQEEIERANSAADRAIEAAREAENSEQAAGDSASAAAGSATVALQEASAAGDSAEAAASSASAVVADVERAGDFATAAASSAMTASGSADAAETSAAAALVSQTQAATSAGQAASSVTQAAASVTTAEGHADAAQVSAQAAAGSADDAEEAVAGIEATVTREVEDAVPGAVSSAINTTLAAAVVLRAKAGSSAELELVALSDLMGSASSARIRADQFLVDATNFSIDANGYLKVKSINANVITAGQLRGDVRNARVLWDMGSGRQITTAGWDVALDESCNNFDTIMGSAVSGNRAWFGTWSIPAAHIQGHSASATAARVLCPGYDDGETLGAFRIWKATNGLRMGFSDFDGRANNRPYLYNIIGFRNP